MVDTSQVTPSAGSEKVRWGAQDALIMIYRQELEYKKTTIRSFERDIATLEHKIEAAANAKVLQVRSILDLLPPEHPLYVIRKVREGAADVWLGSKDKVVLLDRFRINPALSLEGYSPRLVVVWGLYAEGRNGFRVGHKDASDWFVHWYRIGPFTDQLLQRYIENFDFEAFLNAVGPISS